MNTVDREFLDLWQRVIARPGMRDSGLDRCLIAFAADVRRDSLAAVQAVASHQEEET